MFRSLLGNILSNRGSWSLVIYIWLCDTMCCVAHSTFYSNNAVKVFVSYLQCNFMATLITHHQTQQWCQPGHRNHLLSSLITCFFCMSCGSKLCQYSATDSWVMEAFTSKASCMVSPGWEPHGSPTVHLPTTSCLTLAPLICILSPQITVCLPFSTDTWHCSS